jgi:hypothetical protein
MSTPSSTSGPGGGATPAAASNSPAAASNSPAAKLKRPRSSGGDDDAYLELMYDVTIGIPTPADGSRVGVDRFPASKMDLARASRLFRQSLQLKLETRYPRPHLALAPMVGGLMFDALVDWLEANTGSRAGRQCQPATSDAVVAWVAIRIYLDVCDGDLSAFNAVARFLDAVGITAVFMLKAPALSYQRVISARYLEGAYDSLGVDAIRQLPKQMFELCEVPTSCELQLVANYLVRVSPYYRCGPIVERTTYGDYSHASNVLAKRFISQLDKP